MRVSRSSGSVTPYWLHSVFWRFQFRTRGIP